MIADGANRALAPALQENSAQSLQRFCNGAVVRWCAVKRCTAKWQRLALEKKIQKQYVTDHIRATNQGFVGSNPAGRAKENKGLQSMQALIFDSTVNNQGSDGELYICDEAGKLEVSYFYTEGVESIQRLRPQRLRLVRD